MSAWLFATNHCATAMIGAANAAQGCHSAAAAPASSHEGCHDHHSGHQKKQNPPKDSAVCCKEFSKAAQTDNSLPQFKSFVIKLVAFFSGVHRLPVAPKADLNSHYFDTGPPASFAELVLQRSVLAHAPPILA